MNPNLTPLRSGQAWPRPYLISILEAALTTGEYRFCHQTALAWLASYPGDLPVKLLHAKALIAGGLPKQALPVLRNLVQVDPEFCEAQKLLYQASYKPNEDRDEVAHGCAIALGGFPKSLHTKIPGSQRNDHWSQVLGTARADLANGAIANAEAKLQQILGVASHTPLSGVTHLCILRSQESTPRQALLKLAEHYHQRWPDCLQFMLILAETLMGSGESERAVALLHGAASQDVTGQVATRLWGPAHPYRNLWPERLMAFVPVQIPARVSAYLGWNLLPRPRQLPVAEVKPPEMATSKTSPDFFDPKGRIAAHNRVTAQKRVNPKDTPEGPPQQDQSPGQEIPPAQLQEDKPLGQDTLSGSSPVPETLASVVDELGKVENRPRSSNSDGRFPVYVIFTTQKGLQRKYGVETSAILDEALRNLVTALRKRLDWGAVLIYADEPGSMAQYGLKPVQADDAWKLKLTLVDLDDALGKRGARIGAVLIVGGPEVVPFHYLPNPTDDHDVNVPSDNPYGTRDENYFVPEWPVGRLPGGSGNDPGLLLSKLRAMAEHHANAKTLPANRVAALWQWLTGFFQPRRVQVQASFGFSAEAWKQISGSIFRTIGDPRNLVTSPPNEFHKKNPLPATKLGYFNLHGVPDSAEWFGQRDPRIPGSGPDYPTALHPRDVVNGGRAPQVIFSEACYGTHILKKGVEEALALKFLASGSQAIIGSTVISYGSVEAPLNAADLLGKAFWNFFKDGFPAGEALRRAKISLASEMHERQGYLDGEDQKTLISFLLYGDPLAQERDLKTWKYHKTLAKMPLPREIKTVCDRVEVPGTSEPIPKEVIANVKAIVEKYLPGMRDAQLSMSHEHAECCCEGHVCPTAQLGPKNKVTDLPGRSVVTLSKQVHRARYVHESYARLTLDKDGNMVKLTVSR